jgi:lysophospholipase L1-like esterase
MKNRKLLNSFILILFISTFSCIKMNGQTGVKKYDLDLVFIGNSITQGAKKEEAPPATACQYLRTLKEAKSVEFLNNGISGFTTVDFLPTPDGAFADMVKAVHQLHKDNERILIFSISLGTNDSAEEGPNGSPVSPKSYHKNLKSITDKLLAEFPGCKVVYQQPIWYSTTTYNHSKYLAGGLARLQSYFPELKALVTEYAQTNPGHVFTGDLKAFEYFRNNYLTDLIPESGNAGTFYLHPNKKGNIELGRLWGDAIFQSIIKD